MGWYLGVSKIREPQNRPRYGMILVKKGASKFWKPPCSERDDAAPMRRCSACEVGLMPKRGAPAESEDESRGLELLADMSHSQNSS